MRVITKSYKREREGARTIGLDGRARTETDGDITRDDSDITRDDRDEIVITKDDRDEIVITKGYRVITRSYKSIMRSYGEKEKL